MSKLNAGWKGWLGAAVLGALLAACSSSSRPTVSGAAQTDGPVVGSVSLVDSSAVPVRRTVQTGASGAFTVDASGMTPPFLLKVEGVGPGGAVRLFSATANGRSADVNPITSAAFSGAGSEDEDGDDDVDEEGEAEGDDDDDAFEHQGGGEHHERADRAVRLLAQLRTVLAPLFERYGIADPAADRAAVRLLLADVRFEVRQGVLTVTNRQTDAVIFTGPLNDLASGTFDAGAMPPGPGTTPPPTGEGATLYSVNCASCHGPLATSNQRGASAREIQEAIAEDEGGMGVLSGLTFAQLQAIAGALAGTGGGGGPGACTFTYSAFGACVNGVQERTVISATPAGCTGTPVLTQACGGTPPPIDGVALYATYCAGCHGNSQKGASASSIQNAIDSNRGGMGTPALRALTPEQVAAIAAAP
jgi:mono/diheme cytochrome c family protein